MNLIAHRGYKNNIYKENTIESFDMAYNLGYKGIECDVRVTKDKKYVICHDAFINRVSNGQGLIKNKTYKELLKYNFGTKEKPAKIPLLKTVLKRYDFIKVIELKEDIDLKPIEKYIDDKTIFISFNKSRIEKLKERYPNYKYGILNYVLNSSENYNYYCVCLLDDIMTKNIENYFLKSNIKIFIYGINKCIKYVSKSNNVYYIIDNNVL